MKQKQLSSVPPAETWFLNSFQPYPKIPNLRMKKNIRSKALIWGATVIGIILFAGATVPASASICGPASPRWS